MKTDATAIEQPRIAVPQGRLPDFIIIGAAKAATTTLYTVLNRHPQIFMPVGTFSTTNTADGREQVVGLKEPAFFASFRGPQWELGVDWYRSLFARARPDQLCGEASTTYTRHPHTPDAAERMAAVVPDVRLIYSVRHPVDRAYSHFIQLYTRELYPERTTFDVTFEQFIEKNPMPVDASRYFMQLERYWRFFPEERAHVVVAEDLANEPSKVYAGIFRFLGISQDVEGLGINETTANTTSHNLETRGRIAFIERLRSYPGASLARVMPEAARKPLVQGLYRLFGKSDQKKVAPSPMRPETRARLIEEFEPDVQRLERWLGREFPEWRR